jgi:ubiquinone/menaquinone biosynthesis C-methylase UbiE
MDYDQTPIAAAYDQARALSPARQERWQRLFSAHIDSAAISLVLDLGCGTGRFSQILAAEFGARVVGLDPSAKMIDKARHKSSREAIVFGRASASALPLADGCVDLVFMSQIYHHLPDRAAAARECSRVLRIGGYACVRTGTRENDVVVPNFFPAVRVMLDADLPSSAEITATFSAAGLMPRHHETVREVLAADWPGFVQKSALRADSFLARLSDRGMAALRAHATSAPVGVGVSEEIDWFVFVKHEPSVG